MIIIIIGTQQNDKIRVSVCDAYTATNLVRKVEPMDPNPAYEIVKGEYNYYETMRA